MQKIGLVASEGGMSCAYAVGVVLALVDQYDLTDPLVAVGCSGGGSIMAYYVARQYKSILNVWANLLPSRRFISLLRPWRVLDIDYLVDDIFRKQDTLDVSAVLHSRTKLFISATDAETGERTFFTNDGTVDILEALRASAAAPGLYRKFVHVNGRTYVDGAVSTSLEDMATKARAEGARKVIAIANSNGSRAARAFLKTCAVFQAPLLRKALQEFSQRPAPQLDSNVLYIQPSRPLPLGTINNRQEAILAAINLGYEDAALRAPVEEFLGMT